jgi:hypothetical protein
MGGGGARSCASRLCDYPAELECNYADVFVLSTGRGSELQRGNELVVTGGAIPHKQYDSLSVRSMGHMSVFLRCAKFA